jgi:hypothetical protein
MAAHRYWGLYVTARAGSGNGVTVGEIEMRGTPGGADLCTGGTALGASSFGHVAANAFDNSLTTIWHNAATGGARVLLGYDFVVAVDVVEVLLSMPPAGVAYPASTYAPEFVWIVWSDDGTTWRYGRGALDAWTMTDSSTHLFTGVSDTPGAAGLVSDLPALAPGFGAGEGATALFAQDLLQRGPHEGPFRVAGDVAIEGTPDVPVGRRVRLLVKRTAELARETWSDPVTGAYSFDSVANQPYVVLSEDHTGVHNAAVTDAVTPVPMP